MARGLRTAKRTRVQRGRHARHIRPPRWQPVHAGSEIAESRWRPLAMVICLAAMTAAGLLYANHELAGDLFWLLAAGRYVDGHGVTGSDPFLTLAHGGHWYNQQWLSEWLIFQLQKLGGLQLVSFAYALLLAGALVPLAWACRHRKLGRTAVAWLLFSGSAVCVLQPRAAGFSLLAFALVLAIAQGAGRRRWLLLALPPLFALWANLHGAFAAGLLLVGLLAVAAAIERRAGRLPRIRVRPAVPLALAAAGATAALLLTPLGSGLLDYMREIASNRALPLLTNEWLPTYQHPPALALVVAFSLFAFALYRAHPKPRPLAPALVSIGFVLFALTAARQAVWLGPLAFYLVRELAPAAVWQVPRRVALPAAAVAMVSLAVWWLGVPPAPTQAKLMTAGADYAAEHAPAHGRILMPSGTGSYMLWRHPDVPVV
ncbi:MAG: hypothetical protein QOC95_1439, partial [Thermoleophilaceae bacterium]|nr:hypothetical protein [Thermoleophilaceae bacterium]